MKCVLPAYFLMLLFASGNSACSRDISEVREWRPSDHDHTSQPNNDQTGPEPSPAASAARSLGLDEVTLVTWKQNCVSCHGTVGAGDGPRGPELRATNLTDPAWQARSTDDQIAATIRMGRGAMPAFPLPDQTIAGLVRLVRLMNAAPAANEPRADRPTGAPGAQHSSSQ